MLEPNGESPGTRGLSTRTHLLRLRREDRCPRRRLLGDILTLTGLAAAVVWITV